MYNLVKPKGQDPHYLKGSEKQLPYLCQKNFISDQWKMVELPMNFRAFVSFLSSLVQSQRISTNPIRY